MMHETEFDTPSEVPSRIAADEPRPGWAALDAARELAFTGEIVFSAEPDVRVYVDNGVAYFAERADDPSLGRRLLDAGVVDAAQLDKGTVRVGDVEHLGRLFDRDPSVDRDAVMVMTEAATDARLTELANTIVSATTATAYRHHESGVHRWFVAPTTGTRTTRPVSDVAQLDNSVVEDLPGLPAAEIGSIGDELRIEWTETLVTDDESGAAAEPEEPALVIDDDDLAGLLDGGAEVIPDTADAWPPVATDDAAGSLAATGTEPGPDQQSAESAAPSEDAAAIDGAPLVAQPFAAPFAPPLLPAGFDSPEAGEAEIDETEVVEQAHAEVEAVDVEIVEPEQSEAEVEPELVEPERAETEVEPEPVEPEPVHLEAVEPEVVEPEPVHLEAVEPEVDEHELLESVGIEFAGSDVLEDDPFVVAAPAEEPAIDEPGGRGEEPATGAFHIRWPDGSEDQVPVADDGVDETVEAFAGQIDEWAATPESQPSDEAEVALPALDQLDSAFAGVEVEAQITEDLSDVVPIEPAFAGDEVEVPTVEELAAAVSIEPEADLAVAPPTAGDEPAGVVPISDATAPADEPTEDGAPAADVDLEIPALVLTEVPSPDDEVPDEVSNAVLRAIRAIESASTTAPTVAPISAPDTPPAPEPEPAPMGFAPPTLDMSAEAIYARQAAEMAAAEAAAASEEPAPADPEQPRVASVVFVDDTADEHEPEPESRAGALRRLIDSIRNR